MILIDTSQAYWIVQGKTDLRKGIDALAILLQHEFDQDPFNGAYYFFSGRRSDRFKVFYLDGEGIRLFYKRLENEKLHWLKDKEPKLEKLKAEEISRLLAGFPIQSSIHKSSKLNSLSLVKYFHLLLKELPNLHFEDYIREKI